MDAIREIRSLAGKQCFVSGMSALVTDLKDLCEQEEPIYVALAVACACAAMMLLLDGWLVPFVFLASIGIAILYNLGSNYFLGEISYITKALSAVLQLAVTMDYSIFLWHSYNEQLSRYDDHKEAMAVAIHNTFVSVIGSSITTIAGFVALCFMSFTLGRDLGLVMAKGVLLGVVGCVTILPSMILLLDKPLQKTRHRSLIPDMGGFAKAVCRRFPIFLVIFALLIVPASYGYSKTNDEVYYDMGQCLPEDMEYVIANSKLSEEFDIASTHMLLLDADLPTRDVRDMIDQMEQVDGVKYVLGLESVVGPLVPEEILPESIRSILKSDRWELMLINSDDLFARPDALQLVNDKFEQNLDTDGVYADLYYVSQNNIQNIVRVWKTGEQRKFAKGWLPAHPTFYVKRGVYLKHGYFDLSYPLAADFELMLRFTEGHGIKLVYLPECLVRMRLGGATSKNLKNIYRQNVECYRAFKKNGVKCSPFYIVYRFIPKIKQFFRHG